MKTLTANVFLKGDRKTVQASGAAALRFRHHLLRMRLAFLPVVLCGGVYAPERRAPSRRVEGQAFARLLLSSLKLSAYPALDCLAIRPGKFST